MSGLRGQIPVIGHISGRESGDRLLELSNGHFSRVRGNCRNSAKRASASKQANARLTGADFTLPKSRSAINIRFSQVRLFGKDTKDRWPMTGGRVFCFCITAVDL